MGQSKYQWTTSLWKGASALFWSAVAFYSTLAMTNPQLLERIGAKSIWASIALAVLAAAWNWQKNHNK